MTKMKTTIEMSKGAMGWTVIVRNRFGFGVSHFPTRDAALDAIGTWEFRYLAKGDEVVKLFS